MNGNTIWFNISWYCIYHSRIFAFDKKLGAMVHNCDYKGLQAYHATYGLPCLLINIAENIEMAKFLFRLGCACIDDDERSCLARKIVRSWDQDPQKSQRQTWCTKVMNGFNDRFCNINFDGAVLCGDIRRIKYLMQINRAKLKSRSALSKIWNDCIVQDFFVNETYNIWLTQLQTLLYCFPSRSIVPIICDYLKSWENFSACSLQIE